MRDVIEKELGLGEDYDGDSVFGDRVYGPKMGGYPKHQRTPSAIGNRNRKQRAKAKAGRKAKKNNRK